MNGQTPAGAGLHMACKYTYLRISDFLSRLGTQGQTPNAAPLLFPPGISFYSTRLGAPPGRSLPPPRRSPKGEPPGATSACRVHHHTFGPQPHDSTAPANTCQSIQGLLPDRSAKVRQFLAQADQLQQDVQNAMMTFRDALIHLHDIKVWSRKEGWREYEDRHKAACVDATLQPSKMLRRSAKVVDRITDDEGRPLNNDCMW